MIDMIQRPRRLRGNAILRKMVRETRVDKSSLIYPIFVQEGDNIREEIPTMPGQYRYSVDRMSEKLDSLKKAGVDSVIFSESRIPKMRWGAALMRRTGSYRRH